MRGLPGGGGRRRSGEKTTNRLFCSPLLLPPPLSPDHPLQAPPPTTSGPTYCPHSHISLIRAPCRGSIPVFSGANRTRDGSCHGQWSFPRCPCYPEIPCSLELCVWSIRCFQPRVPLGARLTVTITPTIWSPKFQGCTAHRPISGPLSVGRSIDSPGLQTQISGHDSVARRPR